MNDQNPHTTDSTTEAGNAGGNETGPGLSTVVALFYIGFFVAVIGIALKAIARMLTENGSEVPGAVAPTGTVLFIGGLGVAIVFVTIEAIGTASRRR